MGERSMGARQAFDEVATLRARLAECERERDEARRYGEDLFRRAREVTCVWCGHQFESTLGEQRDALHAHALVCPQHPIGDERRRAEAAHAQIAALREALQACDGNAYTAQLEGEDIEANLRGIQDIARAALSAAPPPAARDALAERVASALGVEG